MKNTKYHTVGTILNAKYQKSYKEKKSIPLTHKYMTARFPDLVNARTNPNNVNKTWALLQITGDKDEPNIVFMLKSYTIPKSNIKIVEREQKWTPLAHKYMTTHFHDLVNGLK